MACHPRVPRVPLRLLKIGGSVITDKTKPYTPRHEVIGEIAAAVAKAYFSGRKNFILGHGGGSFPHTSAKKYGVVRGIVDHVTRFGVGVVHRDATEINQIFMMALHGRNVPALSFHPSSFIFLRGGEVEKILVEPLECALGWGLVPVVYGDVVVDGVKGSKILSTETVFEILTKYMKVGVIGMAERFGGVFTSDPSVDPSAELVERVDRHNAHEVLSYTGASHGIDVTGGMRHKLERLLELAKRGVDSILFKGTPENIERFLMGKKVEGTYITW